MVAESPFAVVYNSNEWADATITYSATVQNTGSITIPSPRLRLMLMIDGNEQRNAGQFLSDLAPGASVSVSAAVDVHGDDPAGTFWARAEFLTQDGEELASEESVDLGTITVDQVGTDFVLADIQIPTSVIIGEQYDIRYRVVNQGDVAGDVWHTITLTFPDGTPSVTEEGPILLEPLQDTQQIATFFMPDIGSFGQVDVEIRVYDVNNLTHALHITSITAAPG